MELGSRGDALSFSRVVSTPVQAVNSVTSSKAWAFAKIFRTMLGNIKLIVKSLGFLTFFCSKQSIVW